MGQITRHRSTKNEARLRADSIRHHAETLWGLLLQAWECDDHLALGYDSWRAYVAAEFDVSRGNSYKLLDQARVTLEIESAVGGPLTDVARDDMTLDPETGLSGSESVAPRDTRKRSATKLQRNAPVSGRQAQVLKKDAPQAAAEIAEAVKQGAPVQEAVKAAVAKRAPTSPTITRYGKPTLGPVRPNGAAPAELLALLALDPTASGKHAGRPALALVRQARLWLDRFEGAIKGAQPIVTESDCLHPSARRIGRGCGACGKEKV